MFQAKLCLGRRVSAYYIIRLVLLLLFFPLFLWTACSYCAGKGRRVSGPSCDPSLAESVDSGVTLWPRGLGHGPARPARRPFLHILRYSPLRGLPRPAKTRLLPSREQTNRGTAHMLLTSASPYSLWREGTRGSSHSASRQHRLPLGGFFFPIWRGMKICQLSGWLPLPQQARSEEGNLWWGHYRHTGQRLCCSQLSEVQTVMYVSSCLATLCFYKNPVNYLLFRARNYYSTAPLRSNISHELTVNSQARATSREVPVSISGQNILPSEHENKWSWPG